MNVMLLKMCAHLGRCYINVESFNVGHDLPAGDLQFVASRLPGRALSLLVRMGPRPACAAVLSALPVSWRLS